MPNKSETAKKPDRDRMKQAGELLKIAHINDEYEKRDLQRAIAIALDEAYEEGAVDGEKNAGF